MENALRLNQTLSWVPEGFYRCSQIAALLQKRKKPSAIQGNKALEEVKCGHFLKHLNIQSNPFTAGLFSTSYDTCIKLIPRATRLSTC